MTERQRTWVAAGSGALVGVLVGYALNLFAGVAAAALVVLVVWWLLAGRHQ